MRKRGDQTLIQAAACADRDFEARLHVFESGAYEQALQAPLIAIGAFAFDEQGEAIFDAEWSFGGAGY